MKSKPHGFTLIELLVVIAIIGILATVVLAAITSARTKGRDASLQSDMTAIRQQAAIYYDDNSASYGVTTGSQCNVGLYSDPVVTAALDAMLLQNGAVPSECYANGATYGVAATRPTAASYSPSTVYWCVDSTGQRCGIDDTTSLSATGLCGCP